MPGDSWKFDDPDDELRDEEFPDEEDSDDDLSDTIPCPDCGADIYEDAVRCPVCGSYVTADTGPWSGRPRWWILLAAAVVLALIVGLAIGL
jgi:hypothetical protein